MSNLPSVSSAAITRAISWCIAWGSEPTPNVPIETLQQWRSDFEHGRTPSDTTWTEVFDQAKKLSELADAEMPSAEALVAALADYPTLSIERIGLVYGGVTKVKSYVFESADLQEIRGGSALLDRINLVDLPALFYAEKYNIQTNDYSDEQPDTLYDLCKAAPSYCDYVRGQVFGADTDTAETPSIRKALIPELIIYSTGGNILALCPAAFVDELCNTIEKRYTTETLTANSCAVGETFRPAELYFGLLKENIVDTCWRNTIADSDKNKENKVLQAYFGFEEGASADAIKTAFQQRKNFGELVGKLTSQFNQRRSGDDGLSNQSNRPSRRHPPMFETHPFIQRDDNDARIAVSQILSEALPDTPKFSEPTARKRRAGQVTKRENDSRTWWQGSKFAERWQPNPIASEPVLRSWVNKFEIFLKDHDKIEKYDPTRKLFDAQDQITDEYRREARSLTEIGASSNGYVGYIYSDGNSMGQYIREQIKTPAHYQQFSQDMFEATQNAVYWAITDTLTPYYYQPDGKSSRQPNKKKKDKVWIHPFEIVAIGGDDVLIIVPANKAAAVAKSIGTHFERLLKDRYPIKQPKPVGIQQKAHRYRSSAAPACECCLSTSSGVLITAANTPIYYADKLVSQLLKSAKQHLKDLKEKEYGYYGGTVDVLVLKAVTMISSDISTFRKEGLILSPDQRDYKLKLYGAPYTLHELDGLIKTVQALKRASFPKSQLYQLRNLLSRGKRTAILNYLYFRSRLTKDHQKLLKLQFEDAWCKARTNNGNIAPWLTTKPPAKATEKTTYETIWRDLVELEPFIEVDGGLAAGSRTQPSAQPEENLA